MSTPAATSSTTKVWYCGRCRRAYKTEPASESACRCPVPVATMRPTYVTETAVADHPRRKLHSAGEPDQVRAQFARRGKRVAVTITGTVDQAWTANGEDLTLIVETDDGRRFAVRPEAGDVLAEPTN